MAFSFWHFIIEKAINYHKMMKKNSYVHILSHNALFLFVPFFHDKKRRDKKHCLKQCFTAEPHHSKTNKMNFEFPKMYDL